MTATAPSHTGPSTAVAYDEAERAAADIGMVP